MILDKIWRAGTNIPDNTSYFIIPNDILIPEKLVPRTFQKHKYLRPSKEIKHLDSWKLQYK